MHAIRLTIVALACLVGASVAKAAAPLVVTNFAYIHGNNLAGQTQLSVQGYYTSADGGGGLFDYDGTSCTDNGGTELKDVGGNCWKRQINGGAYSVLWFGAYGDSNSSGSSGHDDTNAISNTITAAGYSHQIYLPGTQVGATANTYYKISAALVAPSSSFYEAPGVTIVATGSNYTALSCAGSNYNNGPWRVILSGPGGGPTGAPMNGFLCQNIGGMEIEAIVANNFNGFAVDLSGMNDSTVVNINANTCGNATYYCVTFGNGTQGFNVNHVLRLQAENCYLKCIFQTPDGVGDEVDNIHSEGAVGSSSYPTYILMGNGSTFTQARIATNDANTVVQIGGSYSLFQGFRVENSIPVQVVTGNQLGNTIINPEFYSLAHLGGNFGPVTLTGGSVRTIQDGSVAPWTITGTTIGTIWTQSGSSPPSGNSCQIRTYGALVGSFASSPGYPTLCQN